MATQKVLVRIGEKKVPCKEVTQYNLVKGPSKFDLITAWSYRYPDRSTGRRPMTVTFVTDKGERLRVLVDQLGHEDGSGGSHLVHGYVLRQMSEGMTAQYEYEAWYNSESRKGTLVVHDKLGEAGR